VIKSEHGSSVALHIRFKFADSRMLKSSTSSSRPRADPRKPISRLSEATNVGQIVDTLLSVLPAVRTAGTISAS